MDDEANVGSEGVNSEEVLDSLGMNNAEAEPKAEIKEDLPQGIKERLGRQEKRHRKEMRELQAQMASQLQQLQSQFAQQQPRGFDPAQQPMNAYSGQAMPSGGVEDQIQKAVRMALQAKDEQERQARQAEEAAIVHQEYQGFANRLDAGADKYDDFDEVVRGNDAPFTPTIRDTAMLLPNPEEVLYKLGKNREELARISKLPAIKQAKELIAFSHSLTNGESAKPRVGSVNDNLMGEIKGRAAPAGNVNGKTSVSELRQMLKNGWR